MSALFKFEEGERAFERSHPRAECPYQEDSREGAEWLAGWDSACHAAGRYADSHIKQKHIDESEGRWPKLDEDRTRQSRKP